MPVMTYGREKTYSIVTLLSGRIENIQATIMLSVLGRQSLGFCSHILPFWFHVFCLFVVVAVRWCRQQEPGMCAVPESWWQSFKERHSSVLLNKLFMKYDNRISLSLTKKKKFYCH